MVGHSYKYDPRVRARGVQDPKAHNFPYSFDAEILATKPIAEADGSLTYRLEGYLNDTKGYYEIGVNPRTGLIFHKPLERVIPPKRGGTQKIEYYRNVHEGGCMKSHVIPTGRRKNPGQACLNTLKFSTTGTDGIRAGMHKSSVV